MSLESFLKECEQRCEEATPGPWSADDFGVFESKHGVSMTWETKNKQFIAASRTDLPKALKIIRVMREALERYKHRIPMNQVITPENAKWNQECGLGKDANDCLKEAERIAGE